MHRRSLGVVAIMSIIGTAIYSRRTYEELVKLNQKIDQFIDRQNG
jgi:hypothetical protein